MAARDSQAAFVAFRRLGLLGRMRAVRLAFPMLTVIVPNETMVVASTTAAAVAFVLGGRLEILFVSQLLLDDPTLPEPRHCSEEVSDTRGLVCSSMLVAFALDR